MKYTNINCNKEHKQVLIPEETRKKIGIEIKRAFLLLEVPLFVLTSCSGLRESQKDIDDTENPGHSYIDTDDENKDNNRLDITFQDNGYKNQDITYEQLVMNLNAELDKKDFSEQAKEFFRETLDSLYNNYPDWQIVYKDMPSREEYIQRNLIDAVGKINNVNLYEENSEEAKRLAENGEPSAFTTSDSEITLVYKNPKNAEEFEHRNNIESFFHEVIHCNQHNIVFNEAFFNNDENKKNIFVEGSATFHMKFVNKMTTEQQGNWSIANEDGTNTIDYKKDSYIGYLVNLNAYENLVYLVGYDTIYEVEQGQEYSKIEESITSKYGKEKGNELIRTMLEWYNEFTNNWQSDKVYNLSMKLQNLYLDCIKEDIKNLDINNKEQIKEYMEIYRNYKLKNLPQVINSKGENCTYEAFSIDSIDNMLIDKIIESNAIDRFSSNEKLNRMAIKSLLFTSDDAYYDKNGMDNTIYLPHSLESTEYSYSENNKKDKGKLTLKYQNRGEQNQSQVLLDIVFDENAIIHIAETDEKINILEKNENYER